MVSYYSGMLLVITSNHTGRSRYEDMADALFGRSWGRFTSYMNLICLMGFTVSYIVYLKSMFPKILTYFVTLPSFMDESTKG